MRGGVLCSRGKAPGELPNGRSREERLVAFTLQVHHASSALQVRQITGEVSQWSR